MILNKEPTKNHIREFQRPKIDFEATAYYKLVKREDMTFEVYSGRNFKGPKPVRSKCSFPPMIDRTTFTDLSDTTFTTSVPCHSQRVEMTLVKVNKPLMVRGRQQPLRMGNVRDHWGM